MLGAAAVLLALGGLATVATQDTWLDGYGIIAYFLVPLAFIPLAAGTVASPRANRFVESVFTAPVERRDWFVAKVLVILTLAAAYYVALLPMMAVYVHHVGVPLLLKKFLLWAPGILVASISIGTLIGVLFIGRSIAAPAATGMGLLLAFAGFAPLQELLVAQGNGATRTARLALASPAVLLKNALGFTLVAGNIPATTMATWVSLFVVTIGPGALATWVFLRAQGVETWEATRAQRWTIALTMTAILLFPVMVADRNYDVAAPPPTSAPAIRAIFARGGGSLALVSPGAPLPARCCGTILNRDVWPIGTDEDTRQDLIVLFPVDATERLTDVNIHVAGESGLRATADPQALQAEHLATYTYGADLGPAASDGHRVATGWIVRIPVALNPTLPWDIGGNRYPIAVTATYRVGEDPRHLNLTARGAINAQVANAIYEMGIASAIFPILCVGLSVARWRRTR